MYQHARIVHLFFVDVATIIYGGKNSYLMFLSSQVLLQDVRGFPVSQLQLFPTILVCSVFVPSILEKFTFVPGERWEHISHARKKCLYEDECSH